MSILLPSQSNYKPIFIGAVYRLHSDTLLIVTQLTGLPVVGFKSGRLIGHSIKFILQKGASKTEEFDGHWQFINNIELVSKIVARGGNDHYTFFYTKPIQIKERLQ